MESKQDTVSNVQFTCPSSGCWQSLEEWFANLSTMLQTICQWTSGGCHTNPNIEQNENESFRDHLLHSLSLLILTCLVPCILQLCPASFWDASAGSRGTGHVRFSGLAAEKLENRHTGPARQNRVVLTLGLRVWLSVDTLYKSPICCF